MRLRGNKFNRAGRRLLALWLACVVLSLSFPPDLVADSTPCHMACCEGAAPHSARKCSGGTCHANMNRRPRQAAKKREVLCGLKPPARATVNYYNAAAWHGDHEGHQHDAPDSRWLTAAFALRQPCATNCAPTGSAYTPAPQSAPAFHREIAARPPPFALALPAVVFQTTVSFHIPPGHGAATLRGPPVSRS